MINDYHDYHFSKKETIITFLQGMIINLLISLLFYNSFWAVLPCMAVVFFYFKEKKRLLVLRRMRQMRIELKEFFNMLIAALQTGRSIENAFSQGTHDLYAYLGKETEIVSELKRICTRVGVGEPLERLLLEFSDRSHLEELEYFSEVFLIAKRGGGNLVLIMKNTIRMLQERMEVEEEIFTVIAEKRIEFYIMCIIPVGIILCLRVSAGNLIQSMYGNIPGVIVMTICLVIYGGCYLYGKRLIEYEG